MPTTIPFTLIVKESLESLETESRMQVMARTESALTTPESEEELDSLEEELQVKVVKHKKVEKISRRHNLANAKGAQFLSQDALLEMLTRLKAIVTDDPEEIIAIAKAVANVSLALGDNTDKSIELEKLLRAETPTGPKNRTAPPPMMTQVIVNQPPNAPAVVTALPNPQTERKPNDPTD